MNGTIQYQQCPACSSHEISAVLTCRDYLVSGESFEIWQCNHCSLRFTQQAPDEANVGKYYQSENYISHSDTGKGLVNQLYKTARTFTLASKRKLLIRSTGRTNGRLLDIGCGTGAFVNEMKTAGWQVTGLEPDSGARAKAAELYNISPLPSEVLFELPPASFEAITLWHVLEHVHDLHGYFKQFKNLLANGGRLVVAVPNYTSSDAAHYKQHWAAYDVPRHLYHFSPASMQQLAEQHGFTLKTIKPMLFDPFYISILSEQYISGKGNLLKAALEGINCTFATLGDVQRCSSLIYIFE